MEPHIKEEPTELGSSAELHQQPEVKMEYLNYLADYDKELDSVHRMVKELIQNWYDEIQRVSLDSEETRKQAGIPRLKENQVMVDFDFIGDHGYSFGSLEINVAKIKYGSHIPDLYDTLELNDLTNKRIIISTTNNDASLNSNALTSIFSNKKDHQIGKNGIGIKICALNALRYGCDLVYELPDRYYRYILSECPISKEKKLCLKTIMKRRISNEKYVSVFLFGSGNGPDIKKQFNIMSHIRKYFLFLNTDPSKDSYTLTKDNQKHTLLFDEQFKDLFYVKGIFVFTLNHFSFGFNTTSEIRSENLLNSSHDLLISLILETLINAVMMIPNLIDHFIEFFVSSNHIGNYDYRKIHYPPKFLEILVQKFSASYGINACPYLTARIDKAQIRWALRKKPIMVAPFHHYLLTLDGAFGPLEQLVKLETSNLLKGEYDSLLEFKYSGFLWHIESALVVGEYLVQVKVKVIKIDRPAALALLVNEKTLIINASLFESPNFAQKIAQAAFELCNIKSENAAKFFDIIFAVPNGYSARVIETPERLVKRKITELIESQKEPLQIKVTRKLSKIEKSILIAENWEDSVSLLENTELYPYEEINLTISPPSQIELPSEPKSLI